MPLEKINKYREILEQRGIKPSLQRLKILEYVKSLNTPPSVDEIFKELAPYIPTLSKTTIYNTLKLFEKENLVVSFSTGDNELRYDCWEKTNSRFICSKCNKIYNISLPEACTICKSLKEHKAESIQIQIKGICSECLSETEKKKQ